MIYFGFAYQRKFTTPGKLFAVAPAGISKGISCSYFCCSHLAWPKLTQNTAASTRWIPRAAPGPKEYYLKRFLAHFNQSNRFAHSNLPLLPADRQRTSPSHLCTAHPGSPPLVFAREATHCLLRRHRKRSRHPRCLSPVD